MNYEEMSDANNLMVAARECTKGVTWKYSTQAFYLDRINRVATSKSKLDNMERMSEGFTTFKIDERGKVRNIRAVHINERMVQKAQSNFVLIPNIKPKLIYDNYASLEGRGMSQALSRVKVHLQRYYRTNETNEGYILSADLRSYFDSINHDYIYEECKAIFKDDPKTLYLIMDFVNAFGDKSLGLGSQISQILAVFYPNKIDHYIKEQLKIKGYGRYMDDFYLIHKDKEYLHECLGLIEERYNEIGIKLNMNKTKIKRIDKGFKYLKVKIHLTETGKVIMRPDRDNITKERQKLKKLKVKHDEGLIEFEEIQQQYNSFKGHLGQFNSYKTIQSLDKLFHDLFIKEWRYDNVRTKQQREPTKLSFGRKQNPAERRHGLELVSEWNRV